MVVRIGTHMMLIVMIYSAVIVVMMNIVHKKLMRLSTKDKQSQIKM